MYTRLPNIFTDPAGVGPLDLNGDPLCPGGVYTWSINHTEEEEVQNSRQMADGAPTSDIGLMPQQGTPYSLVFQWKGTIFNPLDKFVMDAWYGLCNSQSIYLTDFTGARYEVLITDWDVQRKGVAANKRGGNIPWLYSYTIIIRVLNVIAGDWYYVQGNG